MLNRVVKLILFTYVFLFSNSVWVKAADIFPPFTTLNSIPSVPNGENGWYTTFPIISLTSLDLDTGVREINWKINEGDWNSTLYTEGLNLILNSSFESGYINNWSFVGGIFAIGYKSSFLKNTGQYAAGIINLNYLSFPYWENTHYLEAVPLENYKYSFSMASITSFLDNGFYEIVSINPNGEETVLVSKHNVDIKLNFKQEVGTFTSTGVSGSVLVIRIGLEGIGHLSIDDVSMSLGGEDTLVEFSLDKEGENTVWYYAKDGAGNIEETKNSTFNVDVLAPSFSNFEVPQIENVHKFVSTVDVTDSVSGLVSDPTLFNYSVDGFNNGYYSSYTTCEGDFNEEGYLVTDNNYSNASSVGKVTTPTIDYCDSNWINCKRLNFYVKDLAGNIGDHSICVNGPYIATYFGDVFGREAIWNMGLGDMDNIQGIAVSSGSVSDVSIGSGTSVAFYNSTYLNTVYNSYYDLFFNNWIEGVEITNNEGVYYINGDYSISTMLNYAGVNQLVFINGDLKIDANVLSLDSSIYYFVNGDVTIANNVTQVGLSIISTNEFYTSVGNDLAYKLDTSGNILAQNINFTRNTDRTLGPSEVFYLPLDSFLKPNYLRLPKIYWKEVQN